MRRAAVALLVVAMAFAGATGGRGSEVRGATNAAGLIAFLSTRDGTESLYAIRPDRTDLTRLVASAQGPRLSPDGEHVVFETLSYDFRVLDTATGQLHPFSSARGEGVGLGFGWGITRWPWSPDSTRFAVGSAQGVRVFNADGTGERQISDGDDAGPAWSPDGKLIAFNHTGDVDGVYVVGADGKGLKLLVRDGDEPQWSPDGGEVSFIRTLNDGSITTMVVPATGGTPRRIAAGWSAWSPDSRTLAVAGTGLRLYARDGKLERVLAKAKDSQDPAWSPDGRTVLAVAGGDLWLFARDGSGATQLTQGSRYGYMNGTPSWSQSAPDTLAGTRVQAAIPFGGPLVAVSRRSGRLVSAFPRIAGAATDQKNRAQVSAIVGDGHGGWYLGGDFVSSAGVSCQNLIHVGANRSVDRSWCPRPDMQVSTLRRLGTILFVGGRFSRIAGETRRGLAAFDTRTGRLTRWNPSLNAGAAVYEIAPDPGGNSIYLAGEFDKVGALKRSFFAAVDTHTGRPTAFAPNPDADRHGDSVSVFAVTRTHVYSWGEYSRIGGKAVPPTSHAPAQLDAKTGRLVGWRPSVGGFGYRPFATTVIGDRVIVGGSFNRLGGKPRDGLASFDGTTATVDPWAPATGSQHTVGQIAPAGRLILAAITIAGGERLIGYDTTTARRAWQAQAVFKGGGIEAIATSNNLVLIGGSFAITTSSP